MKVVYLFELLFILFLSGCASKRVDKVVQTKEVVATSGNVVAQEDLSDKIYAFKEVNPRFSEGNHQEWISRNIKYPREAVDKRIQGKVGVQAIIEKDGKIGHLEIIGSSGSHLLDAEALRLISRMPDWIPGQKDGRKVRAICVFPISFLLTP